MKHVKHGDIIATISTIKSEAGPIYIYRERKKDKSAPERPHQQSSKGRLLTLNKEYVASSPESARFAILSTATDMHMDDIRAHTGVGIWYQYG